ncbi:MAG: DUF3488 domain-containing protein [Acidipropionibacterium sp.]|nr:DUF3488 domain-containing protein [Acidipropionibacterium sp.]
MNGTSRTPIAMCGAVAVAMILATLSLSPLTSDRSYWWMAGLTILVVEALSAAGRRLRLAPWVIHLVQLLVVVAVGIGLGLSAARGLGLEGSPPSQLWQLGLDSSVVVQTQAAPLPVSAGVRWLTVLLIGVVTILADILTVTLESPVWAIAPLLTIYIIPALAAQHATPWWSFALIAVGYLVVLITEQWRTSSRWTRNLVEDSAEGSGAGASGALAGLGAMLAVPAVVLSLLLGSALPGFGNLTIDSARPRGTGPMQLTDPTIDLQKNLSDQSNDILLTYQTTSRTGEYLRMASLTRVDSQGWHLAPADLTTTAPDSVPGLAVPGSTRTVRISIRDFGSEFLPAPYAPVSTTAGPQWSWDPQNLTIISTADNRDDATRELSYSVTSQIPQPDLATFESAAAGTPVDTGTTTGARRRAERDHHPHPSDHRLGEHPGAAGHRDPGLSAGSATVHLQHHRAARRRLRRPDELPHQEPLRLLHPLRRRDGPDGPHRGDSLPGLGRIPAGHRGGWAVAGPRDQYARLAGAVLPGLRVGALRADRGRRGVSGLVRGEPELRAAGRPLGQRVRRAERRALGHGVLESHPLQHTDPCPRVDAESGPSVPLAHRADQRRSRHRGGAAGLHADAAEDRTPAPPALGHRSLDPGGRGLARGPRLVDRPRPELASGQSSRPVRGRRRSAAGRRRRGAGPARPSRGAGPLRPQHRGDRRRRR